MSIVKSMSVSYEKGSDPSIERTPKSRLRCLSGAAHVER